MNLELRGEGTSTLSPDSGNIDYNQLNAGKIQLNQMLERMDIDESINSVLDSWYPEKSAAYRRDVNPELYRNINYHRMNAADYLAEHKNAGGRESDSDVIAMEKRGSIEKDKKKINNKDSQPKKAQAPPRRNPMLDRIRGELRGKVAQDKWRIYLRQKKKLDASNINVNINIQKIGQNAVEQLFRKKKETSVIKQIFQGGKDIVKDIAKTAAPIFAPAQYAVYKLSKVSKSKNKTEGLVDAIISTNPFLKSAVQHGALAYTLATDPKNIVKSFIPQSTDSIKTKTKKWFYIAIALGSLKYGGYKAITKMRAAGGFRVAARSIYRTIKSKVSSLFKSKISNPVPERFARVIEAQINPKTLGRGKDVFVTDIKDIINLDAKGIANKLTIPKSPKGFRIIEFPSKNIHGIASPINRSNPGFVGKGLTASGAKEYVIPNQKIPKGAKFWIVE